VGERNTAGKSKSSPLKPNPALGRLQVLVGDWDMVAKRMRVELDGQTIFSKGNFFSPVTRKFHLDVGTSETHKVEVSAGPFSPIKVLVDGKPAQHVL
jgi:hypothetical protein